MTALDANLIALIDQRIRASQQVTRATGTCVSRDTSGPAADVVFDGSTVAMPVKVLGNVFLQAGYRCVLTRYGSDWVVTGTWSALGLGESSSLIFGPSGGANTGSATFVDFVDFPPVIFNKAYDDTYVRMGFYVTAYTETAGTFARWGLRWTATTAGSTYTPTDYSMNYDRLDTAGPVTTSYCMVRATNIPAGRYSVQVRYRRVSGTGTVRTDGNSIMIMELDEGVRALTPFL